MRFFVAFCISISLSISSQADAQFKPFSYHLFKNALAENPELTRAVDGLKEEEKSLRAIFQGLPPIDVAAFDASLGTTPKNMLSAELKSKAELEIQQSGMQLQEKKKARTPSLVIQLYKSSKPVGWSSSVELKEFVTLNRSSSAILYCTTYLDEQKHKTYQEAKEALHKSVEQFCLMYLKYGKLSISDQ